MVLVAFSFYFKAWFTLNKPERIENNSKFSFKLFATSIKGGSDVKFNTIVGMFNSTNPVVITSFLCFSCKIFEFVQMFLESSQDYSWSWNIILSVPRLL